MMSNSRLGSLQVKAAMQVTAMARVLQPLLIAVDGLMEVTKKRQRDFLAAWGATEQDKGDWGDDVGNVVYASCWGLLVSLCNGGCQCCNITGFASSAQMMETLMGIAYWARAGVGTLEDFRRECVARQMAYKDVWDSTFSFLKKEACGVRAILGWYPMINEYAAWWGDLFMGKVVGKLLARWKHVDDFVLGRVLHAVECLRRGWWGVGDEIHDKMFQCMEWPPRVVDGEVVGGCEKLAEYARQVEVPIEVWQALPCLAEMDFGGERVG